MTRVFLNILILFFGLVTFGQGNNKQISPSIRMVSLNSSGGDAASSSGSVAYSIGIVQYTNIQSSNNIITPGVQHSLELEAKVDTESILAHVLAYPNPTTNYVVLDIIDFNNEPAQYQIFSSSGSLMKKGSITERTTKLVVEHWSNATYFLKLSVLNKFEQTLKIIKR